MYASCIHRLSGIGLAMFLPAHFLVLGLALSNEAALDGALRWTDQPLVKLAEAGLVFLLTVHAVGGIRLLVLENLPWRDGQKTFAALAVGCSALVTFTFLLRVF